jgi:hypothetical protein
MTGQAHSIDAALISADRLLHAIECPLAVLAWLAFVVMIGWGVLGIRQGVAGLWGLWAPIR